MASGTVINVRVAESTHDELAALSKLEQRSIMAMARVLIEEALETRRQQGGGSRRQQRGPEVSERPQSEFERLMGQPEPPKARQSE
ncbi:MAG: hypothetical protein U0992_09380 [Planctomycetaceae bacterium]